MIRAITFDLDNILKPISRRDLSVLTKTFIYVRKYIILW